MSLSISITDAVILFQVSNADERVNLIREDGPTAEVVQHYKQSVLHSVAA